MVLAGRVTIDGHRTTDPSVRVDPGTVRILVDNAPLRSSPRPLVLLFNKPTGVVSTVDDPLGRPTVMDFCKRYSRSRRLYPVGRLDVNTTGLLLLTNDGELCYRLTHPRFEIRRTYHVRVRGLMNAKKVSALQRLVSNAGRPHQDRSAVELVKQLPQESILKITLHEGRNRQVHRMCESVGLRVVKLRRVQFGPLSIRHLPLGAVRPLLRDEVEELRRLVGAGEEE
jgi:23S rRNA pseudouridine2605 synthase